jgi:dipeptidyl aminopeptidase/acylaminoacyl peptidase
VAPRAELQSAPAPVEALTLAGKPYDLVVLPEQTHRLGGPHREYYLERVRRYLEQHLRP